MSDSKTFVLLPGNEESFGQGLLTNWSPFNLSKYTSSFSNFRDIVLRDNAWVSRTSDSTDVTGGAGITHHLYFYTPIDTTSGTATPTTILIASNGNASPYGLYRADFGGAFASSVDPNDLCFLTIKNRLFIAGNGIAPTITTKYPALQTYSWGKAGPTSDLTYTAYTQASTASTKVFFQAANGGTTVGVPTITAAAGTPYTASPTWDGKTVLFDGTEKYTISTSTTTVLTLTSNAAATKATKNVEVHYGNLSWGSTPPRYAYAYYNPTTGHTTPISNILTISEQNMDNVNVALAGIQCTNDTYYTKIILFRTARDGGVLFPLKLDPAHGGSASIDGSGLINNTGVGTVTYFDGQPDQKLGAVIGLFDGSQLVNNQPPPADVKFMEYWAGRVWFNTLSQPWRLQFSGDSQQIPLGVAEESIPPTNYRDIPANDGQITGMRVVGSSILICTNKSIYYVDGTNEGNFTLIRLSSRGQGVNHFAIDEHPGDSTEQSASAIYVSADNRMWRHFPGGRVVDIGWQIQDKLDAVQRTGTNRPFLVKVAPLNKNWVCVLAIRNQANTGYVTFFYDFDTASWYDWGYGAIGSSTIANCWGAGYLYASTKQVVFAGNNSSANVYTIQDGATATGLQATFTTQALDFGSRRTKKSIESINVFCSDDSLSGWQVQVQYDQAGGFVSYTKDTIANSPRYRGPGVMMFSPPAPKQFHSAEVKLIWGTTTGTPPKVYRVEIVYRPESTGEAGSPS